jgi:hypothetical protein
MKNPVDVNLRFPLARHRRGPANLQLEAEARFAAGGDGQRHRPAVSQLSIARMSARERCDQYLIFLALGSFGQWTPPAKQILFQVLIRRLSRAS